MYSFTPLYMTKPHFTRVTISGIRSAPRASEKSNLSYNYKNEISFDWNYQDILVLADRDVLLIIDDRDTREAISNQSRITSRCTIIIIRFSRNISPFFKRNV